MEYRCTSPTMEAKKCIHKYGINSAPIDVEAICRSEKIRVFAMDMKELESITQKAIAGVIQKHSDYGFTILVNESDIGARKRFIIAHELGHYFLHMEKEDSNKIITSFRMDSSPTERQANVFAVNLLIPEDLVRQEHARMVIPVSDSLAKIFCVTKQTMRIRLNELELIYI